MTRRQRKTWFDRLSIAAAIIGWLVAIVATVWTVSADRHGMIDIIATNALTNSRQDAKDKEQDSEIRSVRERQITIANDVKWMRAAMEADQKAQKQRASRDR